MFIGTALKRINLGTIGYGILIGWLLFFILFIVQIEYVNKKYPASRPNFQTSINLNSTGKNNFFKIKNKANLKNINSKRLNQ